MSRIIRLVLAAAAFTAPLAASAPAAAQYSACVADLRAEAQERGVPREVFDAVMRGVAPDPKIVELSEAQPEFVTPIWDYLATLVDDQKVTEGRAMLQRHAGEAGVALQA